MAENNVLIHYLFYSYIHPPFQVLLLSESQKSDDENNRVVESTKAHYDILMSQRESQHRDEISQIENDNKEKFEAFMQESLTLTQVERKGRDEVECCLQEVKLENETIIAELQKRICEVEKHSLLTLKTFSKLNHEEFIRNLNCMNVIVITEK